MTTSPGEGGGTTKFIFVTGGVVSSLGKGIAAASLGRLLVELRLLPLGCPVTLCDLYGGSRLLFTRPLLCGLGAR